jgi:hypothetical protein
MIRLIDPPNITVALPDGVTLTCRGLGAHALQEWRERSREASIVSALAEIITSWGGVADHDGNPVLFSGTALAAYLDGNDERVSQILNGFLDALREAREKN